MSITFRDQFPPTSEGEIEALEAELQAKLSDSYRNFLLEHNGGRPSPNGFLISESEGNDSVMFLFGITNEGEYGLRKNIKEYTERMPYNLLPIGCDSFGNLVCISLKGDDIGKIYFWDQDREVVEGTPDYSNVTLVSNSFQEFMDSLCEFSP